MLIEVNKNFIDEIEKYSEDFYISEKMNLYIYDKKIFLKFLFLYKIKFINIINNKDYYYLISDNDVLKYFNSKNIFKYILKKVKK